MKFNEFEKIIIEELQKTLGTELCYTTNTSAENNGITAHTLTITNNHSSSSVYLDKLFEIYESGYTDIQTIAKTIMKIYTDTSDEPALDIDTIINFPNVCSNLRGRLINTSKNEDKLIVPHRNILDLSLIYIINIPANKGSGIWNLHVTNSLLDEWGVTENDLYNQMIRNLETCDEGILTTMESFVCELFHINKPSCNKRFPMYVLTNKTRIHGAIQMLNRKQLQSASVLIGNDFWILPSSTHELLLIPVHNTSEDLVSLTQMLAEVNNSCVPLSEILSYQVYHYNFQTGEISIAG